MHAFVGTIEGLKPGDHFSVFQGGAKSASFSHYEVVWIDGGRGRMIARDSHLKLDAPVFETTGYSMQIGGFRLTKKDGK